MRGASSRLREKRRVNRALGAEEAPTVHARLVPLQFLEDRRVDGDDTLPSDVRLLHRADRSSRRLGEVALRWLRIKNERQPRCSSVVVQS